MKGKSIKRMLALVLTAASVLASPCSLAAKATDSVSGAQTGVSPESPADAGQVTESAQPMEANGFINPEGENASVVSGNAEVSFGVVSDTHVTAGKATEQARLKKAFEFYSDAGVDSVVVAGDLTDGGSQSEYDTWQSVKDESLTVPLIASMGNHEGNSADRFIAATGNKPNEHKVVNGYHFITVSPGSGTLNEETGKGTNHGGGNYTYTLKWLKERLDEAVAQDPEKPVFVFFHHPIKDTFYVSNEWYGSGLTEIFKEYPQAVTFSGHIHSPNNMPTSIWQDGGYTAVNTVTLSYMEMETGMIYGSIPPNASQIAQGLVVEANGSTVTIKNYDFLADQWIPQTWTFDVTETLPYTDTREASAKAPYFTEDAQVTVSEITDESAKVEFPQAKAAENNVGDIVHSYRYDFVNKLTGEVDKTFKTWSEYYFQPMPDMISQVAPDLKPKTSYEVRIYAINAYQQESEGYLSAQFTTTGEDAQGPGFDDMVEGVGPADLLDVDFVGGTIADHSPEGHTFRGSDGSNIVYEEALKKEVATFTGSASETFSTDWSDQQYEKTNDNFTMESLFMVDEFSGNYVDVLGNMESAGIGIEISKNKDNPETANVEAWVHVGGSYQVPIAYGAIAYGEWNHITITYDGSKVTLYINGQKIASKPASGTVKTPPQTSRYYVIGGDSGSDGSVQSPMTGAISTARMYSEALTANQVYMLANRELSGIDTESPQIQVSSEPAPTGEVNKEYIIPSARAADNSTVVTVKAVVTDESGAEVKVIGTETAVTEEDTFIPDAAGVYKLSYIAIDKAGNEKTEEFSIEVAEDVAAVDKTLLQSAYDEVSEITAEGYTETSFAVFEAARTQAQEMLQNVDATQTEVDEAYKILMKAKNHLISNNPKVYLETVLNQAKEADRTNATAEASAALEAAIEAAEDVLAKEDSDTAEMLAQAMTLLKMVGNLDETVINLNGLNMAIQSLEVLDETVYTAQSWETLLTAYEAAKAVTEDESADQTVINEALDTLGAAVAGLQLKVIIEKEILTAFIAKAEAVDKSIYTEESVMVLEEALQHAKAILADETITDQAVVDDAVTMLEHAINGLVKTEVPDGDNNGGDQGGSGDNNDGDQGGGDNNGGDQGGSGGNNGGDQGGSGNNNGGNQGGSGDNNGSHDQGGGSSNGEDNHNGSNNSGSGNKKPTAGKKPATNSAVKTGDQASPIVPVAFGILGLAGIITGIVLRRRKTL